MKTFNKVLVLLTNTAMAVSLSGCGDPDGVYHQTIEYFGARTENPDPTPPSSEIQAIHNAAPFIIDLHNDTLLHPDDNGEDLYRLLVNEEREGHTDVNRLLEGNMALQVFAANSKGSLDVIGDALPWVTGYYDDAEGVYGEPGAQLSRYNFVRDPNVAAYDDEKDPYESQYQPIGMKRDLATYIYRLAGMPCSTWYEDGNWSLDWGVTPSCDSFDPNRMYVERLLETARKLKRAEDRDPRLTIIRSNADLINLEQRRQAGENILGAMLSTEGVYFRSDDSTSEGQQLMISIYNELYEAGYRMFALTHFIDNDYGGSSTGMARAEGAAGRELKPEGHRFAQLVIDNRTILDLAHASKSTFAALVEEARNAQPPVPVIYSHGGLSDIPGTDETCANSRNIDDLQILDVASTGGVVGVGFSNAFVCDTKPIAWATAIRHAVDIIDNAALRLHDDPYDPNRIHASETERLHGIDHVALGTDYDGGIDAYTDVDDLNQYTEALVCEKKWYRPNCLDNPFTPEEAYKILGGNSLRVMKSILN